MMYVFLYLFAIVAANLVTARFGPVASVVNAFLFIGFDLVSRDKLHDSWAGRHLWAKMFLLIAAGSALSYLLNRDAGQIALASLVAFAAAGLVDAVSYHLLRHRSRLLRMNGSNIPAALVDSVVFPTLAFGSVMPLIVLGQFLAKVIGGAFWSLVIHYRASRLSVSGHGA